MSDNVTTNPNMLIEITGIQYGCFEHGDHQRYENLLRLWRDFRFELDWPLNASKYVNYLIRIKDETGNSASATLTVQSINNVMTVAPSRACGEKPRAATSCKSRAQFPGSRDQWLWQ